MKKRVLAISCFIALGLLGLGAALPVGADLRIQDPGQGLYSIANGVWTGNEEALSTDGPASTAGVGTMVRLQKFDRHLDPVGQWAYPVDLATEIIVPSSAAGFSGLADLVVLPDGRLLALERELGGPLLGIRNRIYSR